MNRASMWLTVVLALVFILLLAGGLLLFGIRTNRVEVAVLPRSEWGFYTSTAYWYTLATKGPVSETKVYHLGFFSVTMLDTRFTRFS
jgi:hypothetical protein